MLTDILRIRYVNRYSRSVLKHFEISLLMEEVPQSCLFKDIIGKLLYH